MILLAPPTIGAGYAGSPCSGRTLAIALATLATVVLGVGLGLVRRT